MSAEIVSHKTKIEDEHVDSESESTAGEDDDHHVHDEHCSHSTSPASAQVRTIGRKERAARKEIAKSATLKPLPHIKRVTFKRHNGPIFAVSNAEVFLDTTSGCYVVYGQPMIEQTGLGSQAAAMQKMAAESAAARGEYGMSGNVNVQDEDDEDNNNRSINKVHGKGAAVRADSDALHEDGAEMDSEGLDEKDIAIVMDQAHVTRAKAIKALRANGNDIVNTIMELTM